MTDGGAAPLASAPGRGPAVWQLAPPLLLRMLPSLAPARWRRNECPPAPGPALQLCCALARPHPPTHHSTPPTHLQLVLIDGLHRRSARHVALQHQRLRSSGGAGPGQLAGRRSGRLGWLGQQGVGRDGKRAPAPRWHGSGQPRARRSRGRLQQQRQPVPAPLASSSEYTYGWVVGRARGRSLAGPYCRMPRTVGLGAGVANTLCGWATGGVGAGSARCAVERRRRTGQPAGRRAVGPRRAARGAARRAHRHPGCTPRASTTSRPGSCGRGSKRGRWGGSRRGARGRRTQTPTRAGRR